MNEKQTLQFRLAATALSLVFEVIHLGWEFSQGGVLSHHLLNSPDLPAFSNWWGLLLLPAMTWFLTGLIARRLTSSSENVQTTLTPIISGLLGALAAAILLSVAFNSGNEDAAFYVLVGILVMALIFPVYRAEYFLGFVHGMTFTFGAVLPTIIGLVIAAISATVHLGIRPLIMNGWKRVQRA